MGAFLIQVLFAHERVPKTSGSVNILGSETLKCHQSVDPDIQHKHFMCPCKDKWLYCFVSAYFGPESITAWLAMGPTLKSWVKLLCSMQQLVENEAFFTVIQQLHCSYISKCISWCYGFILSVQNAKMFDRIIFTDSYFSGCTSASTAAPKPVTQMEICDIYYAQYSLYCITFFTSMCPIYIWFSW